MIKIAVAFALLLGGIFVIASNGGTPSDSVDIPKGPIHWHPRLTIYINGERQYIPANIGITIGKSIDHQVSGMRMSPIHTHTDDGVLHYEQNSPTERTIKLGYFFYVWEKRFSSECIFEYCNGDGKTVKMFVNGEPNFEFENYIPKDGDDIVIRHE